MSVSNEFTTKVKMWATYDQKSRELRNQLSQLNKAKEQLSMELIPYIKQNNLQKTALNFGEHRVCYFEDPQYTSLSYNFLKDCLTSYYNNDVVKADQMCNYIRSKREKTLKSSLKHYIKKPKGV
jgi:hypothetical protein